MVAMRPMRDWRQFFGDEVQLGAGSVRWWRPDEIREGRGADALPLEGLRLALDPGHIGGRWAPFEGRHFRVDPGDHWVREGELVLEVALLVEAALSELGADVVLLRRENRPVNTRPF